MDGVPIQYLRIKKMKTTILLCVGSMGGEANHSNSPIFTGMIRTKMISGLWGFEGCGGKMHFEPFSSLGLRSLQKA